ncbi:hypothetical protein OfM1_20350 [Lactovum odontotermitis]
MTDYPKCIKAEMVPGPELWCTFDNGAVRYFPMNTQIELLMRPLDVMHLKETYGANLFIGRAMTWMGNKIMIDDNGDVQVNKEIIPAEILWKYSKKHLNSPNPELEKKIETKHPILRGILDLSWLWISIILVALVILYFVLRILPTFR